jgi:hypothetical protein
MKTPLFALLTASVAIAQPALQSNSLNAGWLWPKGVYTLVIHDGPGPKTDDIAAFLNSREIVADFFQVLCHYAGQPAADQRSAMCNQQHMVPVAQLTKLQSLHQCVGNHGQDHLNTPTLNQADTVYQIGGATSFLQEYWQQQDCPALVTFPGFQTDAQHNGWLNQDSSTSGRQQGPIWADFDGSGTIPNAGGPVSVNNDQDCFTQGFSQQQCVGVMLGAMAQANHGGIVNIHDFNPYAFNPLDPTELKSAYAYDYVKGIINGCQAANNGNPCIWLKADAIPGVHRARSVGQFTQVSNSADDFSDRIADVLVGDVNGDSHVDVLVPRSDGLYCAINSGNGALYPLQRCLGFTDSSMAAGKYWLVDLDGDKRPYVLWINAGGLTGVKADGRGGFGVETRLLSANLAQNKMHGAIYRESIHFGRTRVGSTLPDLVAMSASGVVVATNNGNGFEPLHAIPHLAYQAATSPEWSPESAGKHLMLVDLSGTGTLDIVVTGHAGLLYAKAAASGFTVFKPLTTVDGFNHWTAPKRYTSLHAAHVGGSVAIAGWTPVGIDFATFKTVSGRPTVEKFQVLCSDCFASLPGWLGQWQHSNMTAAAFQTGFADLMGTGSPQAFAVWGKGLYAGEVSTLAGYR